MTRDCTETMIYKGFKDKTIHGGWKKYSHIRYFFCSFLFFFLSRDNPGIRKKKIATSLYIELTIILTYTTRNMETRLNGDFSTRFFPSCFCVNWWRKEWNMDGPLQILCAEIRRERRVRGAWYRTLYHYRNWQFINIRTFRRGRTSVASLNRLTTIDQRVFLGTRINPDEMRAFVWMHSMLHTHTHTLRSRTSPRSLCFARQILFGRIFAK